MNKILVACHDAPEHIKQKADYVCDGIDDRDIFNQAINALPDGGIIYIAGELVIGGVFPLTWTEDKNIKIVGVEWKDE